MGGDLSFFPPSCSFTYDSYLLCTYCVPGLWFPPHSGASTDAQDEGVAPCVVERAPGQESAQPRAGGASPRASVSCLYPEEFGLEDSLGPPSFFILRVQSLQALCPGRLFKLSKPVSLSLGCAWSSSATAGRG